MFDDLEAKFLRTETGGDQSFLRVSAEHPLDLFVGCREGRRAVLLICESEPPAPPLIDAVSIEQRLRDDGRWALIVSLEKPVLASLFNSLVADLIWAAERHLQNDQAVHAFVDRLRWWQRLLARSRTGLLTDEEAKGLVGELVFLRDYAIPSLGVLAAIAGWVGPSGAPRDFLFADTDVEVKAIRRDAGTIRISSLAQLEPGQTPVTVATVVVERTYDSSGDGRSLESIVDEIHSLLLSDDEASTMFLEQLWSAGYVKRPEYKALCFSVGKAVFYGCADSFPRLTRALVPDGLVDCEYDLELNSIRDHVISDWQQNGRTGSLPN